MTAYWQNTHSRLPATDFMNVQTSFARVFRFAGLPRWDAHSKRKGLCGPARGVPAAHVRADRFWACWRMGVLSSRSDSQGLGSGNISPPMDSSVWGITGSQLPGRIGRINGFLSLGATFAAGRFSAVMCVCQSEQSPTACKHSPNRTCLPAGVVGWGRGKDTCSRRSGAAARGGCSAAAAGPGAGTTAEAQV